jgi:uncharacterized protein YqgQ
MAKHEVSIKTDDGVCPASVFEPSTGSGPWPGVLMYMDGVGIRPALFDIAQKLADAGYVVLLPDLFYRIDFTSVDPKKLFSDPELRKEWSSRVMPSVTIPNIMRDTKSFLPFLSNYPKVTRSPRPRRTTRADSRTTIPTVPTSWRRGCRRACTSRARSKTPGSMMRKRRGWSGR